jgi:hypothetical protein
MSVTAASLMVRVTDGIMAGYRAGDDRGVLPNPK